DPAACLETIHVRHDYVHKDQIGPFGDGHAYGSPAISSGQDVEFSALLEQHFLHEEGRSRIVHEQNFCAHMGTKPFGRTESLSNNATFVPKLGDFDLRRRIPPRNSRQKERSRVEKVKPASSAV